MRRRLLLYISALALASVVSFQQTADSQQRRKGKGPSATVVSVAKVQPRTLKNTLRLAGTAVAASQFTIGTQTSGRLVSLPLQIGQYVKKGQLIAQMEPQNFEQDIRQIKADVEVLVAQKKEARATLALAEKEFSRDATLYTKKLVSKTELDTSRTTLDTQRSRLSVLDAQMRQKKVALQGGMLKLSDTKIYARWPGKSSFVVSKRLVDAGATVTANTALVELVSLDPILIRTPVSEKDFAFIKAGQSVSLESDAYPGQKFLGTVARVAPVLDAETRNAEVEVQLPNPKHQVKPGMFLQGELTLASHVSTPAIPREALVEKEGKGTGVFVVQDDQKVKFIQIKTGFEDGDFIEVLSPALSGDIVTLGNHLLKDGASIRLEKQNPKGEAPKGKRP